ncbi:MAG TPA: hypothetical protein VN682_17745 [Terriglobales bacterium]|jgi:hypothetical protein|nr:hypothetical protein [Terriglobales bacterium]
MPEINQAALQAIQPELTSGESVLWAGQPSRSVTFHSEDLYLIPFSLLWGGFAIFWEAGVAGYWGSPSQQNGPWIFGMIWGVPFVLIGQYMIWGRFLFAAWRKKRTFYAVTSRRVIAVQDGWSRNMASAYIDTLPTIMKASVSTNTTTLRFAQAAPMWTGRRSWGVWDGMAIGDVPTFVDIDDADYVYRIVSEIREKARAQGAGRLPS